MMPRSRSLMDRLRNLTDADAEIAIAAMASVTPILGGVRERCLNQSVQYLREIGGGGDGRAADKWARSMRNLEREIPNTTCNFRFLSVGLDGLVKPGRRYVGPGGDLRRPRPLHHLSLRRRLAP